MRLPALIEELREAFEASKMATDTRKTHYSRKDQIDLIADALEVIKKPPSDDNDGEAHEVELERVHFSVFDCTYNDVVARAVLAAQKIGGWGATVMTKAAEEREKLNKTRAGNAKKYK